MTKETKQRIHRFYGWLTGIMTVIAGVCLMVACVTVYRSGDRPYSREAVAAAFAPIAIPVYSCLALVVGGCLLQWLLPEEPLRLKGAPSTTCLLRRLYARTDFSGWQAEDYCRVEREQKARRLHSWVTAALAVTGGVVFLFYALNSRHFGEDITRSVIAAMYWLLPCTLIPCGYGIFTLYHRQASLRRELTVVKGMPMQPVGSGVTVNTSAEPSTFPEKVVRYTVLAVGLALLVYGFATGGIADVLTKAVNICTECIGLG